MNKNRRYRLETLLKAWTGELRFEKMRAYKLLDNVKHVISITDDPIAKEFLEIALRVYELEGTTHARILFSKK